MQIGSIKKKKVVGGTNQTWAGGSTLRWKGMTNGSMCVIPGGWDMATLVT